MIFHVTCDNFSQITVTVNLIIHRKAHLSGRARVEANTMEERREEIDQRMEGNQKGK
jgi:hypothetical protein